jgi:hypothetical protein
MKVKEFLADPNHWCVGSMARDRDNVVASTFFKDRQVIHMSAVAKCCLVGAVCVCYNNGVIDVESDAVKPILVRLAAKAKLGGPGDLTYYNDNIASYKDILNLVTELDI